MTIEKKIQELQKHIKYIEMVLKEKKQKGFIDLFLNGKTFYGETK